VLASSLLAHSLVCLLVCVGLFVGGSVGACVRFTRFFWCMLWGHMCLRLRYLAVN